MPGGLGYTYPNPIQQRDKLWLFWRGGNWNPTFSYTRNGHDDWVPARELVRFRDEQRPYAKYCGDGRNRIHCLFSDAHPSSWKTSLHYARYQNSALYAASGRRLGTFAAMPLHTSKLDTCTATAIAAGARGRTTSRSTAKAGRTWSTRGASAARATPSTTRTSTERGG